MSLRRVKDIDEKLCASDAEVYQFYIGKPLEELFKRKEALIKELEISNRLGKQDKFLQDAIGIVELIIEKTLIMESFDNGTPSRGVVIG